MKSVEPNAAAGVPGSAAVITEVATLPVIEERLEVAVERFDAGAVRVRIVVDERVEGAEVELVSTEVQPTVVARDVEVAQRLEPYIDGEDLVVPVYEERTVVERRLFLKQEVRLTRVRSTQRQQLDVPLRRERAVIERQRPDGSWAEVAAGQGTAIAPESVLADPATR